MDSNESVLWVSWCKGSSKRHSPGRSTFVIARDSLQRWTGVFAESPTVVDVAIARFRDSETDPSSYHEG